MTKQFTLTVNGQTVQVEADPDAPLLSVLRDELDLKGARFGCGLGQCGACFVQLDGKVVSSCDTPMWATEGTSVVTVEGLGREGVLHPVQQAILDEQAAQCGYCISGVVVRAAALLESTPSPDAGEVVDALDRNLCRCGVQRRIISAVVKAGASR
ncbi:MAG: (2Fe-2S)-binding protein [Nocardioidaceae bacterium]